MSILRGRNKLCTPLELERITSELETLYPKPRSELVFRGEYQLVVSVILSAQCTDKKVNQVTPGLFAVYRNFGELGQADITRIESLIRPINYYRTKARNLVSMARVVSDRFGGKLPRTHAELIELPGVGNKTANVVLSELGAANTFPVDTHVFRVSQRLALAFGKSPEEIEAALCRRVPERLWRSFHHWLIFHGRRVCHARSPKCGECVLASYCAHARREKKGG